MIHLKYKCKVNFVKLPLICIDLCLKLVFENAIAGRSVVNWASEVDKNNAANANDKPPSWVHHPPAGSVRRGWHEGVYGN